MKVVFRRIYDRVALDQLNIRLSDRDAIIKLVSLVYSQISAPIFRKMIQYSWYATGYADNHPGDFVNVIEAYFSVKHAPCDADECASLGFICCAWCRDVLCFSHFYVDYHYH